MADPYELDKAIVLIFIDLKSKVSKGSVIFPRPQGEN